MFVTSGDDLESGLATRYGDMLSLLECGQLFPSFDECVDAQQDALTKAYVTRRIHAAVPHLVVPVPDKQQFVTFLQTWDGVVESLLARLEQLVGALSRARQEHAEWVQVISYK